MLLEQAVTSLHPSSNQTSLLMNPLMQVLGGAQLPAGTEDDGLLAASALRLLGPAWLQGGCSPARLAQVGCTAVARASAARRGPLATALLAALPQVAMPSCWLHSLLENGLAKGGQLMYAVY